MIDRSHSLQEEYTVDTPESVAFGYEVAGIGSRFIAALVDTVLLVLAMLLVLAVAMGLMLAGGLTGAGSARTSSTPAGWVMGFIWALLIIIQFIIFWGYYIFFELSWNGQTPGKRLAGLRVIRVDGNPIGALEAIVRNLVRLVDFLPTAYAIGFLSMFFSRQSRRLGDYAAGTLVIKERQDISLATLAPTAAPLLTEGEQQRAAALAQQLPNLRVLTAADLDLITATLQRQPAAESALLERLARAIATKLGLPPPPQARPFLEDVLLLQRQRRQPPPPPSA